jgi:ankyrin repeat protein
MLSQGGANPNAANHFGLSLLHWASMMNDVIVMDILIAAGADVHIRDHDGATPLHLACREESVAAVAMLLRSATKHKLSALCIHHKQRTQVGNCHEHAVINMGCLGMCDLNSDTCLRATVHINS